VELPTSTVALTGSGTDDNLPSGSTLTYKWTAPANSGITFTSDVAASTTANVTTAGTYTITLTVSDGSLSSSDTAQVVVSPVVYPTTAWTTAAPADVAMDAAPLDQAAAYALTGGGAGMIIRHGRLVKSWPDDATALNARYQLKSASKSIGGVALGLAIDDQLLQLTDTAQTRLPSIGIPPAGNRQDWLSAITVLQLATHTAGFEKPDSLTGAALVVQPGTTWLYSDAGLNWLADVLTTVNNEDLNALLFRRVYTPIGITDADLRWRAHRYRNPAPGSIVPRELASGISANVNALARFGHLFLRRGVWNGQRIVSEAFIDTVRTPRTETAATSIGGAPNQNPADFPAATARYGVLWWTNADGGLPNVPRDAYWGWGLSDSLIVVIPSLDLVIARTGADPDILTSPTWRQSGGSCAPAGPNCWNGDYSVLAPFLDPIVAAVTDN
jgi:CubicO group peptidase (beta-lactamase class C family)